MGSPFLRGKKSDSPLRRHRGTLRLQRGANRRDFAEDFDGAVTVSQLRKELLIMFQALDRVRQGPQSVFCSYAFCAFLPLSSGSAHGGLGHRPVLAALLHELGNKACPSSLVAGAES